MKARPDTLCEATENAPGSFIGRRGVGEVDCIIPRVAIKIHATGAIFTMVLKAWCSGIARAAGFEAGKG